MKKFCPNCDHEVEEDLKSCPFCEYDFLENETQESDTIQNAQAPIPIVSDSYKRRKGSAKLVVLLIVLIIALISAITALAIEIIPDMIEGFKDGYDSFSNDYENSEVYEEKETMTMPEKAEETESLEDFYFPDDYDDLEMYCLNYASIDKRDYEEVIAKFAYSLETGEYETYKEIFADSDNDIITEDEAIISLKESMDQFYNDVGFDYLCYAEIEEEDRLSVSEAYEIQDFLDENNIDLDVLDCYNLKFTLNVLGENEEDCEYEYDVSVYETQDGWYLY